MSNFGNKRKVAGRFKTLKFSYHDMDVTTCVLYPKGHLTEASFDAHCGRLGVFDSCACHHQIQQADET